MNTPTPNTRGRGRGTNNSRQNNPQNKPSNHSTNQISSKDNVKKSDNQQKSTGKPSRGRGKSIPPKNVTPTPPAPPTSKPKTPSNPPPQKQQQSSISSLASSLQSLSIGTSKSSPAIPTVFMVAEKPSLAETISKIISKSQNSQLSSHKATTPIHEWQGSGKAVGFNGPVKFKMTSTTGHIFGLDFDTPWKSWEKDPLELFTSAKTLSIESNPKQHMPKHLEREALGASYLVLWLDCDKEGENIAFEVIKCVKHSMIKVENNVLRAHFSSLTPESILHAFNNLGKPNSNLALSVDVRQEVDLKVGVAFTRFQTKYFQGRFGDLDANVLSYGPCQTPTLALVVKRHDEIVGFQPVAYYTLSAKLANNVEIPILAKHSQSRFKSLQSVTSLSKSLEKLSGKVIQVTTKSKTTSPPVALHTLALLQNCSKKLGMGPMETMKIAEHLYMKGFISYPRTETTQYPKGTSLSIVEELKKCGFDGNGLTGKLPSSGKDHGDHPPITPTKSASRYDLDEKEWKVYELIVKWFLASLSCSMKWEKTNVKVEIGKEIFEMDGQRVIDPGWTRQWGRQISKQSFNDSDNDFSDEDEQDSVPSLPPFKQGDELKVLQLITKEQWTKPPSYLSESELLSLMDKYGIGTDASMATHVSNIVERKYCEIAPKRRMIPTKLGIILIHGYQKIDDELSNVGLRSSMEKRLNEIASGKQNHLKILENELTTYKLKYQHFVSKIFEMESLFEASFSSISKSGKMFSKCGHCKRFMHLLPTNPPRLHCRQCERTWNLPRVLTSGGIQLKGEESCPVDGFQLVVWTTGSKSKSKYICPKCYNDPPEDYNINGIMSCNDCLNDDCDKSLKNTFLFKCDCDGNMTLDTTSSPRFKISCNKCNIISVFNVNVIDVKVLKEECDDCGSRLIDVGFKDKTRQFGICPDCNDELLETRVFKQERIARRGRGRGKGRRGRGRGRKEDEDGPLFGSASGKQRAGGLSLGDFF